VGKVERWHKLGVVALILMLSLTLIQGITTSQTLNEVNSSAISTAQNITGSDFQIKRSVRQNVSRPVDKLPKEFKQKYGEKWNVVTWREYVDAPHGIYGFYSLGRNATSKEDAENISRAFIEDNKALFKIDLSKLKLSRIYEDGSDFSVTYYHYHDDFPVEAR